MEHQRGVKKHESTQSSGRRAYYDRVTQEYENRRQQWWREKRAYIAMHGQAAWDAKVEREVAELYDAPEPFPMPNEKP